MPNIQSSSNYQNSKRYDLEERTLRFGEEIIDFTKNLPQNLITKPLINQLIRSGTSIGANYCEADEANSKKDFINKVVIAKKESKETRYWLKMIAYAIPEFKEAAEKIWKEAQELNLILAAIVRNSNKKTVIRD